MADVTMARQIRIEYDRAAYHVLARGNHGRAIFADDLDRKAWLATLAEACERTGWRIHAYVLMGNHYHLLVETPEGNLYAGELNRLKQRLLTGLNDDGEKEKQAGA